MDHHPLGLVDHQQVPILIDDVQRDILRDGRDGGGVGDLHQDGVPRFQLAVFGRRLAVGQNVPFGDQVLQRAAGQAGVLPGQKAVDPLAGVLGLNGKLTLFHGSLVPFRFAGLVFGLRRSSRMTDSTHRPMPTQTQISAKLNTANS